MSRRDLIQGLIGHLRRASGRGLRKLPAGTSTPAPEPQEADSRSQPAPARPEEAPAPPAEAPAPPAEATARPAEATARPAEAPAPPAEDPAKPSRAPSLAQVEVPRPDPAPAPRPAPVPSTGSGLFEFGGTGEVATQAVALRLEAARAPDLPALARAVSACTACDLCQTRTQTVFMDGQGTRRVMFVGEAPGFHEDRQGVPFVGNAGQLLTDIIEKGMKIGRDEVTIANVLKCRPPENRDPEPAEKALCTAWLDRQIELVDPEVLIGLGRHAAGHLLGRDDTLGRMRGRVHERGGRKIVATYHPAYLLRNPGAKRDTWQDIQLAMGLLGLK